MSRPDVNAALVRRYFTDEDRLAAEQVVAGLCESAKLPVRLVWAGEEYPSSGTFYVVAPDVYEVYRPRPSGYQYAYDCAMLAAEITATYDRPVFVVRFFSDGESSCRPIEVSLGAVRWWMKFRLRLAVMQMVGRAQRI